ncbi:MAG: ABC transporter ATP-binding protein [Thermoguttaceae bacterium]|jgi:ABC-type multidrug transport system ATPase subunit
MPEAAAAILVRRLSKSFGRRAVLRRIDARVAEGESLVVTGANGSGKTTLLGCLASLVRPTSGEVYWFGRPAGGDPAAQELVGMVAHENRLYPHLTLRENLVFAARMHGVPWPGRRADELLEDAGLGPHAARMPPALSRGMRQRAAVARALVHDPPILLADEPFAGLDTAGADWLADRLLELRARGRTLCLVLHDEVLARRLADAVVQLRDGYLESRGAVVGPRLARAA